MASTMCFSFLLTLLILASRFQHFFAETTTSSSNKNLTKLRKDANFMKIVEEFKRLSAKKSKDELRMIASIGLVTGALETMKNMEEHLTLMVSDLILNSDMTDTEKTMPKFQKIEDNIERDRRAIQILATALDLARGNITKREYRNRIKEIARDYHNHLRELKRKTVNVNMRERLDDLKVKILEHMDMMHRVIGEKTNQTVKHLESVYRRQKRKRNSIPSTVKNVQRNTTQTSAASVVLTTRVPFIPTVLPFPSNSTTHNERILKEILLDSTEKNVIEISRRQDINIRSNRTRYRNQELIKEENPKLAALTDDYSDEYDDDNGNGGGGGGGGLLQGGLVGLISALSGGEEGSDVGALFGALTGVVSRLFGPQGLDIPSLLGSGTALISGLLAGERNFGIVLGEYVGVTVDGLSGGGGAINNGKFLGHFLGTVLALLSADPVDEDLPPKPLLFLQNFISSFVKSKNKEDRNENGDDNGNCNGDCNVESNGVFHHGSDSFGFIAHIVRTVIGGVTSFVLNSSLGVSGGSSQGSASLSGASSHKEHPPAENIKVRR